jgi:NTP pyrophosphatase (non-canonical NTP hydrolase)
MTISWQGDREKLGPSSLLPLDEKMGELARRVQALKSPPSPGAMRNTPVSDTKSIEERLFDALADVKIYTASVAMHLDKRWRDLLFRQLDSLHDLAEWENDDQPVQRSSFATFLKAALDIKPQRRPGLGLSSVGHIIASWTKNQDHLTIEFLPNDRVRWVLSRYRDGEPERFSGDTAVARMAEGLSGHHPEYWFQDA